MTGNHLKYIFVVFPIVGIGALVGGIVYRRRLKTKIAGFERIQGAVVDNVRRIRFGRGPLIVHCPVVEYFVGNTRFKVTGNTGYSPPRHKGTTLVVMFRPTNPSEAYLEKDYYLAANIALSIGGVFVLLGSYIAYELCL